jgi:hypothetical protein
VESPQLLVSSWEQFLGSVDDLAMLGTGDLSALLAGMECRQQAQPKLLENREDFHQTFPESLLLFFFLVHGPSGDISLYSIRVVCMVAGNA